LTSAADVVAAFMLLPLQEGEQRHPHQHGGSTSRPCQPLPQRAGAVDELHVCHVGRCAQAVSIISRAVVACCGVKLLQC
jgi:hypothetical protein